MPNKHALFGWPIHGHNPEPDHSPVRIGWATQGHWGAVADVDRFNGESVAWTPAEVSHRNIKIAQRGQSVIGFVAFTLEKRRITVDRLVVVPNERRQHVGLQLMNHVQMRLLESPNRYRIVCRVRESNTAGIAFLSACGFDEALVDRGHYRDTGEDGFRFVYRVSRAESLSIVYGSEVSR